VKRGRGVPCVRYHEWAGKGKIEKNQNAGKLIGTLYCLCGARSRGLYSAEAVRLRNRPQGGGEYFGENEVVPARKIIPCIGVCRSRPEETTIRDVHPRAIEPREERILQEEKELSV